MSGPSTQALTRSRATAVLGACLLLACAAMADPAAPSGVAGTAAAEGAGAAAAESVAVDKPAAGAEAAVAEAKPPRARPPRWAPATPMGGGFLLWFDRDQGPGVGADNLILVNGSLGRLEDRLLPTRLFEDEGFFGRTLSFSYRFTKAYLFDQASTYYLQLIQHEVFGHGWRAREAGYADIEYVLRFPPPYGRGGGSTSFVYPDSRPAGPDYSTAMAMAGMEATDLLAQRQRNRFLLEGSMDYHGALLYLNSALGLVDYVSATSPEETDLSNDVVSWLTWVNRKAGRYTPSEYWVSLSDLEERSLMSLADPFLWFSSWTTLRYLWSGAARWNHPAIAVGPARWLPSLGYRLSPFGGQYLFENLAVIGPRIMNLRVAWGGGKLGASAGADLEAQGLFAWRGFSLDGTLRAWRQPGLWLDERDPRPSREARPGGGLSAAVVSPALFPGLPLRIALGCAGKSPGYVPGESLASDLVLRAGIGLYR